MSVPTATDVPPLPNMHKSAPAPVAAVPTAAPRKTGNKVSERQLDYIRDLRAQAGLDREFPPEGAPGLSSTASQMIAVLKAHIAEHGRVKVTKSAISFPPGRYAVMTDGIVNSINSINFYKVDAPTEGKWAGRVFVKHIVSEAEFPVRGTQAKKILDKIAAGPEEAAARFGHEFKRCGLCFKALTNDDSRKRGIGPKCAAKVGW